MTWYQAFFLGLVQGLAEFLPISSSGHLLLLNHWFGITDGGLLLTIILHLATLLAVVVVYRHQLWQCLRHPFQRRNWQLLLATVITCTLVVVGKPVLDRLFTFNALPFTFVLSGIVLLLPTFFKPARPRGWWPTVVVGIAQGLAVVPGCSRSGFTITAGQLSGLSKTDAADFSFLLSIPIILASLLYELLDGAQLVALPWGPLALAFVTAFAAGLVAIKWLLNLLRRVDLRWFAAYLLLLGVLLGLDVAFQVF